MTLLQKIMLFEVELNNNCVIWAGSVKKWLFKNQPQEVAPLLGFLDTMLNVERVKDNMWLTFIEKLLTNRAIRTCVQTRYLRFKGMSYKSESYLCDISCVQLRKALVRFRCGNT
jgi:hypothetical protein